MSYRPITVAAQLPPTGPVAETLRFDMKMEIAQHVLAVGARDLSALATDVAAFANASGGVLLVGAREEPTGVLAEYVGVDHPTAIRVAEAYQNALRLCSPRPVIDPQPLAAPGGGYVVAVNCDAYAAPPVGVHRPEENRAEPKWWTFPTRRGNRTHNMKPEELATVMEPRLRRMALLLERLPLVGGRASAPMRCPYFHFADSNVRLFWIKAIDQESSALRLEEINEPHRPMTIPLDAVRWVWHDPLRGSYHVAVDGDLDTINSPAEPKFIPSRFK